MASSSSTTSIRPWPARLCDCERAYCIVKKTKTQETRGRDYYSCPIFGTPCANFIQWCDDHQERENKQFQRPRNYVSNPSKQDGELMKQLMLIQTCILVVILLVLLWKLWWCPLLYFVKMALEEILFLSTFDCDDVLYTTFEVADRKSVCRERVSSWV